MKKICVLLVLLLTAGCTPRADRNAPVPDAVRIVSFLPSATETLYALGLGPCVVGRSSFCDYPPEAAALPVVGDLFSANEGALAALRPTHAVLGRADAPQAPLLRALGCEIIEGRAETAADVLAFADEIGRLFPEHTNGLAAAGSPWREAMEELGGAGTAGTDGTTGTAGRVLVVVSHAPGRYGAAFAAGEGTFHDELLRAAGFSNALAGVRGYPSLDPDRIAALAPDLLIDIHPDGDVPDESPWTYLPGTRTERLADTAALRPGPRLPDVMARFRALARRP
ncbi:MAG: ABC transporter substrate-binding protein [Kiritimatiellae bacterium]|nr:ABC transporter substrate-binding protein [Kiritimatiellia bacterium]